MHNDYLVSDWTFNSVEDIVITIYCVLVDGNNIITFIQNMVSHVYSKQH